MQPVQHSPNNSPVISVCPDVGNIPWDTLQVYFSNILDEQIIKNMAEAELGIEFDPSKMTRYDVLSRLVEEVIIHNSASAAKIFKRFGANRLATALNNEFKNCGAVELPYSKLYRNYDKFADIFKDLLPIELPPISDLFLGEKITCRQVFVRKLIQKYHCEELSDFKFVFELFQKDKVYLDLERDFPASTSSLIGDAFMKDPVLKFIHIFNIIPLDKLKGIVFLTHLGNNIDSGPVFFKELIFGKHFATSSEFKTYFETELKYPFAGNGCEGLHTRIVKSIEDQIAMIQPQPVSVESVPSPSPSQRESLRVNNSMQGLRAYSPPSRGATLKDKFIALPENTLHEIAYNEFGRVAGKGISNGLILLQYLQRAGANGDELLRLYDPKANCLDPPLVSRSSIGNALLRYAMRLTADEIEQIKFFFGMTGSKTGGEVVRDLLLNGTISNSQQFIDFLRSNGLSKTAERISQADPLAPYDDSVHIRPSPSVSSHVDQLHHAPPKQEVIEISDSDDDIPEHLICEITEELMDDPVIDPEGHTYDRKNILQWLKDHGTSPFTDKPMSEKDLRPNRAIKNAIDEYKKRKK